MISKNIFIILVIFIVIGLVIYFFYNCDQTTISDNPKTTEYSIKIAPTKKKVRFNDDIQYNYYKNYPINKPINTSGKSKDKYYLTPYPKTKHQISSEERVNTHFSSDSDTNINSDSCKKIEHFNKTDIDIDKIISSAKPKPKPNAISNIIPSNLDTTNPEDKWDSSFGLLLMSQQEQADYFVKMMDNHKKYDKSMGEFYEYLTDQSTIIKTDTTIDPFKPSTRSEKLKGKAVSDIYNEQVAGPEAKPLKIKSKCDGLTTYVGDSEMTGGKIYGTNLFGFDGYTDQCRSATFGNEF